MGSAHSPTGIGATLEEIEDYVKDYCLGPKKRDIVLDIIIDLVLEDENRPLYHNAIEEPYFFSKFLKRWIREGLKEREKFADQKRSLIEK